MSPSPRRARRPVSAVALLLATVTALGAPTASTAQTVDVVTPDPEVLDQPGASALDGAGNLYVAAVLSDNLVRVAPDGTVTVLASGEVALPAPFLDPRDVAVDASDNVYVACAGSDNVFRFEPGGAVSVVVDATGDGLGNALDQPTTVVALGDDVWVAGFSSDNVFHVSAAGAVTLVLDAAGLGGGATLSQAEVRTDAGRVFILGQGQLFEIGPGSVVTELLDETGDGATAFAGATDVCVDTAGNVFAVDPNSVFSVSPGGTVTVAFTLFLSVGGAEITSDSLGSTWVTHNVFGTDWQLAEIPPGGRPVVVIDDGAAYAGLTSDDTGNLYWVRPQSVGSDWVLRRAPDGTLTVMIGQLGAGNGDFLRNAQESLVAPDGSVFVVGQASDNAMHAGPGFVDLLVGPPDAQVGSPLSVDVDHDGRVVVGGFSEVVSFDLAQDTQQLLADSSGAGGTQLFNVVAVETDHAGNVWAAARNTNSVFRISPAGDVDLVLDPTGAGGQPFFQPYDLAVDAQDNVFVSGQGSHNVFRIAPDGTATPVITSTGDGTNPLSTPQGVAVDGAGNLYVASLGTDSVFQVEPGGTITRIVDPTGAGGTVGGLDNPTGVAATWQGDVFVTGDFSHNLLHVDPSGVVTEVLDGTGDGMGNTLHRPGQVEADGFGAAYVVGRDSDNVFRVDPDGTITELLDAAGAGPYAPLDVPLELAVDLSGNVYVVGGTSTNVLSLTQDDWFTDLGGSSLGSDGRPTMWTKGDLTPGSTQDRVLTNVPPNALMLVWIAFQSVPFDAIGGTVYAFPFNRQVLFVADPTGYSELFLPWPAGIASGIDIHLQFVVQDLGVPAGLTLSNATVQTTP